MRYLIHLPIATAFFIAGCAGSTSQTDAKPGVEADASSFSQHGLTVKRPEKWRFVEPDHSSGSDTIVVLHGPVGDNIVAPSIEVSRRALTAKDRLRNPTAIVDQVVLEMTQIFEGFEKLGDARDISIAGAKGARVDFRYNEQLPDGANAGRGVQLFGVVNDGSLFVIRCIGEPDGSNQTTFDSFISSLELG